MDDKVLFEVIRGELFTAVVGDVLDKLGYQHQFRIHRRPRHPGPASEPLLHVAHEPRQPHALQGRASAPISTNGR